MFSFQSTTPSRASTRQVGLARHGMYVSIHDALTSIDVFQSKERTNQYSFNPRHPHEHRRRRFSRSNDIDGFQSTTPSRASTLRFMLERTRTNCFNPRRPHEHRREVIMEWNDLSNVSIHDALTSIDCGKSATSS